MLFTLPMRFRLLSALLLVTSLHLGGCALVIGHAIRESSRNSEHESQVNASLTRYRNLVVAQDAERLTDMFTPSGTLSNDDATPAVGQEQIRLFFRNLPSVGNQDYAMNASSTKLDDGNAVQVGTYSQSTSMPGGAVVKTAGSFEARWQHQADGRWLLTRMHTVSSPKAGG